MLGEKVAQASAAPNQRVADTQRRMGGYGGKPWVSLCSVGRRGPSLQASAAPNQARESKAMSEPQVVRYEVEDGIGVITIDNPPVNALGPGVREGIIDAVGRGTADPGVSALVLIGAGRSFIAGADIRQFGKARTLTTGQST